MQRLADLVAPLGTPGAVTNAAAALADERAAIERVERFLARFEHPAGRAAAPAEPAAEGSARVA